MALDKGVSTKRKRTKEAKNKFAAKNAKKKCMNGISSCGLTLKRQPLIQSKTTTIFTSIKSQMN